MRPPARSRSSWAVHAVVLRVVCSRGRAADPDTVVASGFVAREAGTMAEPASAETVVVPACADVQEHPPATLVDALRAAHDAGARSAGICSGAFAKEERTVLSPP